MRSLSGGAYAATQNPTGAVAKANQNAATQPPTVVVQATSSLPIVIEGDTCNSSSDTAGITADRTVMLTCQSNSWQRPAGAILGVSAITSKTRYTKALTYSCTYGGTTYTNFQRYRITTAGRLYYESSDYCSAPAGTIVQTFDRGTVAMQTGVGYGVNIGSNWWALVSTTGVFEVNTQYSGMYAGAVMYPWEP